MWRRTLPKLYLDCSVIAARIAGVGNQITGNRASMFCLRTEYERMQTMIRLGLPGTMRARGMMGMIQLGRSKTRMSKGAVTPPLGVKEEGEEVMGEEREEGVKVRDAEADVGREVAEEVEEGPCQATDSAQLLDEDFLAGPIKIASLVNTPVCSLCANPQKHLVLRSTLI
jgi:hypothetical protein